MCGMCLPSDCSIGLLIFGCQAFASFTELPHDRTFKDTVTDSRSAHALFDSESLQYVPRSVVRTWGERDFLIALGIPSVDMNVRRRRRDLQRSTLWTFPGVATRANNFTGAMLVLYVLARHPSHNFTYSAALLKEAAEWHDVIALPMNEGRPSTKKTIGGGGYWGMEAEIGLSRKVFLWFELAVRLFPRASYIAKGDDDSFIRVPQYLADLRTLPRTGVYWGYMHYRKLRKGNVTVKFYYAVGTCATLSRDVAESFVSYEPLQFMVSLPYAKEREADFVALKMSHEDMMVGYILYEAQIPNYTLVRDSACRFHNLRHGWPFRPLTNLSVVVHDTTESEFVEVMERFKNDTSPAAKPFKKRRKYLVSTC
ncbi:UDP-Gal or UDP-GlcNAc-dependent glycosyltransferase [Trypanosoma grayi]|uniref:UDP-Gal or UDP-GlcNAc-dependent glycosyltransferase n=1 Tax=Trypanosoma grayi TaxID=71804 RepID=UPI0004F49620|nr:UDP-Gal or UDP-GlcNAc-dependent glycosyltransferase [Trypanosoma grayi]KEG07863.1 UDP-Gal or UDP-GlcNAc-dependent glycosyltransferase [Trypanosoma grayi]